MPTLCSRAPLFLQIQAVLPQWTAGHGLYDGRPMMTAPTTLITHYIKKKGQYIFKIGEVNFEFDFKRVGLKDSLLVTRIAAD